MEYRATSRGGGYSAVKAAGADVHCAVNAPVDTLTGKDNQWATAWFGS